MSRLVISAAFGLFSLIVGASHAAEVTLSLPGDDSVDRRTVTYECGDAGTLDVEYINAGSVSLAVFAHDGEPVVAANVLAASGARYAGGVYVWWSKGRNGSLYNLMQGEDAAPVAECEEAQ
ncbi:MliC family protein [Nitratireductor sp. GCM10026969]|uniref:MliC family protein n=1 Tax=Nitratireductor sp. GCM10026969 TaxID=3252645 RepID=UPI0036077FD5